jgi:hypothetical protein
MAQACIYKYLRIFHFYFYFAKAEEQTEKKGQTEKKPLVRH